ncbi:MULTISPECIES: DUF5666 domain-containing protein [Ferrimicrobium]|uniref:DUF5666 domain-containing protein n=1 Tax=Ferrimicrobium acidiphilum TaxID=121039 RepID=A0ABV3Y648_9ACTN|nr:DUF5666 domain-containing protein [Ferrimicrobium sp.]
MKRSVRVHKKAIIRVAVGMGAICLVGAGVVAVGGHDNTTGQVAATLPSSVTTGHRVRPNKYRHHRHLVGGQVVGVTAQTLTIRTPGGVTQTFDLTSTTAYRRGTSAIGASTLADGDYVRVRTTTPSTSIAAAVRVMVPTVVGRVTGVSGTAVTIANRFGLVRTLDTSSATNYREAGSSVASSALGVGEIVTARGTVTASGAALDASLIVIHQERYAGVVTSVAGSNISLRLAHGLTATIDTNASTHYRVGKAAGSESSVTVGAFIVARGQVSGTNTLAATTIRIGRAHPRSKSAGTASVPAAIA